MRCIAAQSLNCQPTLPQIAEAHKNANLSWEPVCSTSTTHTHTHTHTAAAAPAPSETPSTLYSTYLSHTHTQTHTYTHTHTHTQGRRFPRLSDLHALSFEWHKYLSSLGFCTQPEHTYMAADGDARRLHGHPSDPAGNVCPTHLAYISRDKGIY